MFISKKEYKSLLSRIKTLEELVNDRRGAIFDNWRWSREALYEMMSDYFKNNTEIILLQRDKDKIIGELKGKVMNNIFKENK